MPALVLIFSVIRFESFILFKDCGLLLATAALCSKLLCARAIYSLIYLLCGVFCCCAISAGLTADLDWLWKNVSVAGSLLKRNGLRAPFELGNYWRLTFVGGRVFFYGFAISTQFNRWKNVSSIKTASLLTTCSLLFKISKNQRYQLEKKPLRKKVLIPPPYTTHNRAFIHVALNYVTLYLLLLDASQAHSRGRHRRSTALERERESAHITSGRTTGCT